MALTAMNNEIKKIIARIGTPKHKKVIDFLKLLWNEDEIKLLDNFDMAFQFLSVQQAF